MNLFSDGLVEGVGGGGVKNNWNLLVSIKRVCRRCVIWLHRVVV